MLGGGGGLLTEKSQYLDKKDLIHSEIAIDLSGLSKDSFGDAGKDNKILWLVRSSFTGDFEA